MTMKLGILVLAPESKIEETIRFYSLEDLKEKLSQKLLNDVLIYTDLQQKQSDDFLLLFKRHDMTLPPYYTNSMVLMTSTLQEIGRQNYLEKLSFAAFVTPYYRDINKPVFIGKGDAAELAGMKSDHLISNDYYFLSGKENEGLFDALIGYLEAYKKIYSKSEI